MLIDILNDLLYTVFKPNFECFRKVRYFAKFFMEKDAPRRPFVVFRVRPIGSDRDNSVFSDTLFTMPIFRT